MGAFVAQASLVVCGGLLLLGALWDIRSRRIPNVIPAATILLAMVHQASRAGWGEVGLSWVAGVAVTALLWIPWLKGALGGGDVKIAAAAAMVVGLSNLLTLLLTSALTGGVIALICYRLSSKAVRREIKTNMVLALAGHGLEVKADARGHTGRVSVPYGVAFVVGAYVCILRVFI